jgi:hypothetical protein
MPRYRTTANRLMRPSSAAYTLFDSFSVDAAAGSVNGTFSDKSHSLRTVVDTENKLSISGGKLVFAGGKAAPAWGDPGIWYPAEARVAGKVLLCNTEGSTWNHSKMGFDTDTVGDSDVNFYLVATILIIDVALQVGAVAAAIPYSVAIALRTAGAYYFIKGGAFTNWTLVWLNDINVAGVLYPVMNNYGSAFTADEPRVAKRRWLPEPIAYSTFQGADGPLTVSNAVGPDGQSCISRAWSFPAGTAAISGNAAVISPTAGAELCPDNNAAVLAGLTEANATTGWALKDGTFTSDNAQHSSGAVSLKMVTDAGDHGFIGDFVVTSGVWYHVQVKSYVESGNNRFIVYNTAGFGADLCQPPGAGAASWTVIMGTFRTISAACRFYSVTDFASTWWNDEFSLKPLTLASLFSSVTDAKTSDVMVDVKVAALTAGTQAGVVARLDDATTPANFIIAYFDGAGNAKCDECVAGVYAALISAASVYAANATLRLDVSGTAVRLYTITSAGVAVLVGTATTNVATGTRAGIFSTYVGNSFALCQIFPKGTGNELAALDSL